VGKLCDLWISLQARAVLAFGAGVMKPNAKPPAQGRARFQFTNAGAQRAEASLNLTEALAHLKRFEPASEAPQAPGASTPAGGAFRRVTRILQGLEK
jgi:hypothetical protein